MYPNDFSAQRGVGLRGRSRGRHPTIPMVSREHMTLVRESEPWMPSPTGRRVAPATSTYHTHTTAPATSAYHTHTPAPAPHWMDKWNSLAPGDSIVRIQGTNIKAGNATKIASNGTGLAAIDVERTKIRSPDLSCEAQGQKGGVIIEGQAVTSSSAQNNENLPEDLDVNTFTAKSNMNGNIVEKTISRATGQPTR